MDQPGSCKLLYVACCHCNAYSNPCKQTFKKIHMRQVVFQTQKPVTQVKTITKAEVKSPKKKLLKDSFNGIF